MRIVLYNFVQPTDPPNRQGGGVVIYQRNLMDELRNRGHEVLCLSSGDRYSIMGSRPRLLIEGKRNSRRAVIHDSPVYAPAHFTFHHIAAYNDSRLLDHIPAELKKRLGSVDVFHLQNVEGLTAGFLRTLRRTFPQTRIILSAHNYNLVCPQVNLWYREFKPCGDFAEGRACVNCLMTADRRLFERNTRRMTTIVRRLGLRPDGHWSQLLQKGLRTSSQALRSFAHLTRTRERRGQRKLDREVTVIADASLAKDYARYRQLNVELCRSVFDEVIAVSSRTRQMLIDRGVPPEKLSVGYIGTRHPASTPNARRRMAMSDGLHLAFLGYMRADKGFFFLIESLYAVPETTARNISITIAAPGRDQHVLDRLKGLGGRFRRIVVHDGYSQAGLKELLKDVDLGVIPVLWEDNLPQVAIEFVAHGVPILTSDRGGAHEIANSDAFTFRAGSTRDFVMKLARIAEGATPLSQFWRQAPRIYSMQTHVDELMRSYSAASPAVKLPHADANVREA